jgi:hypothetical protein
VAEIAGADNSVVDIDAKGGDLVNDSRQEQSDRPDRCHHAREHYRAGSCDSQAFAERLLGPFERVGDRSR